MNLYDLIKRCYWLYIKFSTNQNAENLINQSKFSERSYIILKIVLPFLYSLYLCYSINLYTFDDISINNGGFMIAFLGRLFLRHTISNSFNPFWICAIYWPVKGGAYSLLFDLFSLLSYQINSLPPVLSKVFFCSLGIVAHNT